MSKLIGYFSNIFSTVINKLFYCIENFLWEVDYFYDQNLKHRSLTFMSIFTLGIYLAFWGLTILLNIPWLAAIHLVACIILGYVIHSKLKEEEEIKKGEHWEAFIGSAFAPAYLLTLPMTAIALVSLLF